jgi:hypothetical protein
MMQTREVSVALTEQQITDAIAATRVLLTDPAKFTQGVFARDAEGNDIWPNDENAKSFCVRGGFSVSLEQIGVYECAPNGPNERAVTNAFAKAAGIKMRGEWQTRREPRWLIFSRSVREFVYDPGDVGNWNNDNSHDVVLAGLDRALSVRKGQPLPA